MATSKETGRYLIAWRRLRDGEEFRGAPIGDYAMVRDACTDLNQRWRGVVHHWPERADGDAKEIEDESSEA